MAGAGGIRARHFLRSRGARGPRLSEGVDGSLVLRVQPDRGFKRRNGLRGSPLFKVTEPQQIRAVGLCGLAVDIILQQRLGGGDSAFFKEVFKHMGVVRAALRE